MDPSAHVPQIIRYMGSKRNIVAKILPIIEKNLDDQRMFCDLFAGTNAISYAVKTSKNVGIITNDIQSYSVAISKALIENNRISTIPIEEAKEDLIENFEENKEFIEDKWDNTFIAHHQYRTKVLNDKPTSFEDFIKTSVSKLPFCLFTFYFSNVYFSSEQCKEIDSLRFAIENVNDKTKKNMYLTCLLYAISYGSSTYGHFAQPRSVSQEVKKIRKRSVVDLFFKKLKNLEVVDNKKENYCFNKDYKDLFLDKKFRSLDTGFIYMDPPYSTANFSRFYHVLETAVRYDYPHSQFKGRYREDRFKSDFCKRTKVKNEFRNVVQFAHENDAMLLISYLNSHLGLLPKKMILKLCREIYGRAKVVAFPDIRHQHSTMGNLSKNNVKEILILCKQ
ncbi:MAG: hypothetical protein Sv326_0653 [Candidatus Fermentimicrarchaeum limneticum]|uniref:site-specific DNA-methyltransferase (adenine-specific) n=1 Tax=Fermentimicrarchaeum limneticum TaxID=2795018 RepID=A0A7D5XLN7_FERL1|nr:MAG: hypothetical protein Sv326_0653 [Candidatus Fermentimicrarchaeum limneticum]